MSTVTIRHSISRSNNNIVIWVWCVFKSAYHLALTIIVNINLHYSMLIGSSVTLLQKFDSWALLSLSMMKQRQTFLNNQVHMHELPCVQHLEIIPACHAATSWLCMKSFRRYQWPTSAQITAATMIAMQQEQPTSKLQDACHYQQPSTTECVRFSGQWLEKPDHSTSQPACSQIWAEMHLMSGKATHCSRTDHDTAHDTAHDTGYPLCSTMHIVHRAASTHWKSLSAIIQHAWSHSSQQRVWQIS